MILLHLGWEELGNPQCEGSRAKASASRGHPKWGWARWVLPCRISPSGRGIVAFPALLPLHIPSGAEQDGSQGMGSAQGMWGEGWEGLSRSHSLLYKASVGLYLPLVTSLSWFLSSSSTRSRQAGLVPPEQGAMHCLCPHGAQGQLRAGSKQGWGLWELLEMLQLLQESCSSTSTPTSPALAPWASQV